MIKTLRVAVWCGLMVPSAGIFLMSLFLRYAAILVATLATYVLVGPEIAKRVYRSEMEDFG